ncbi:antibiotic biosynthesis monooxygenase [Roseibium sp. SCPC15]|uniref:antibiotic biosynthesis monooxygenase n=1 Tax=Roseibium sp. SCP15 TaxID=3141376 RepID=UPI00333B9D10
MIKRIWHGWTTSENANTYCEVLTKLVIPGIEAKKIPGYLGIEVFRRDLGDEVEFMTIMSFQSLENIVAFQGPDYERCYVPDEAQKVLKRWDQTAAHFEQKTARKAG